MRRMGEETRGGRGEFGEELPRMIQIPRKAKMEALWNALSAFIVRIPGL